MKTSRTGEILGFLSNQAQIASLLKMMNDIIRLGLGLGLDDVVS